MVVRDFNEPQIERRSRAAGSERTWINGHVPRRARTWVRSAREVGATFAVLVLIMMGALALRLALSLPHGLMQ
jgi:hypothetical protein